MVSKFILENPINPNRNAAENRNADALASLVKEQVVPASAVLIAAKNASLSVLILWVVLASRSSSVRFSMIFVTRLTIKVVHVAGWFNILSEMLSASKYPVKCKNSMASDVSMPTLLLAWHRERNVSALLLLGVCFPVSDESDESELVVLCGIV